MVTHDSNGPLLLTAARAQPFIAHYFAAEGFPEAKFRIIDSISGTVTIAVVDVPRETMATVETRLREHVCVGVRLWVVDDNA